MDWITLVISFVGSFIGAAIPVATFVFWMGGLAERIRLLCERCNERGRDHQHHYEVLNKHEVQIGRLDTRVGSLETWRTREEA